MFIILNNYFCLFFFFCKLGTSESQSLCICDRKNAFRHHVPDIFLGLVFLSTLKISKSTLNMYMHVCMCTYICRGIYLYVCVSVCFFMWYMFFIHIIIHIMRLILHFLHFKLQNNEKNVLLALFLFL